MKPLCETTLDPEVRSLDQVRTDHADEAGKIFETLMGDAVEPRRELIQSNAQGGESGRVGARDVQPDNRRPTQ